MPKFDAAWTEKLEILNLPHWFLLHFFTICRKVEEKAVYRKKIGVTDQLREWIESKVNATASSPITGVRKFFKNAQKQLAQKSLIIALMYK